MSVSAFWQKLRTKQFYVELECRYHVDKSFLIGVALTDYYPLYAERVGDESV